MPPDLMNATLGVPPPASPLGASNYAEISQMGAIDRALPTSGGVANVAVNQAQDQVRAAKAAAAAAAKKAADKTDPKKYRKVPKDDGGFDFFDPDGNQVDIATLTKLTGTKARDWVSDSQNPIDIQYIQDSKNMQEYIQAKLGGDKKKTAEFEEARPELARYQGQGGADQLIQDFKKHYQRYYVPRSQDPRAWGTRPSNSQVVPRSADPLALGGGIGG